MDSLESGLRVRMGRQLREKTRVVSQLLIDTPSPSSSEPSSPVPSSEGDGGEGGCSPTATPRAAGQLFPYFVCRVGGLPVRYMEALRADGSVELIEELLRLEEQMEVRRDALVECLHAAVGDAADRRLRGKLLRLKRDVHNLRPLRSSQVAAVLPTLSPDLAAELQLCADHWRHHGELEAQLAVTYEAEVAACRRRFQRYVEDDDFRQGLLLSSQPMFAGLRKYSRRPVARLGAKERQLERGLMRYFSRMVMKTSPFGTFTSIVEGQLMDERDCGAAASGGTGVGYELIGEPRRKQSLVRLNKGIYGVLQRELSSNDAVRDALPVERNPTLRRRDGQWHFLSGKGMRETFQRVPTTPVLDLFVEILQDASSLPLQSLRRRVGEQVDAPAADIARYTERLLDTGFLRFRFGIGEQEVDWDRPLGALLADVDDPDAAAARRLIESLRRAADDYADADVEGRRRLLSEARQQIAVSYDTLNERRQLRTDVPFYEDAGAAARLQVPAAALQGLEETLLDYIRLTSRLAWPRHDHASMRHFFDTYYADAGPIPLLQFYEDYYREHLKEHLHKQERMVRGLPVEASDDGEGADGGPQKEDAFDELNPFELEVVDGIKDANDALTQLLRRRWREAPEAQQILLERRDLQAAVRHLPAPHPPCLSISVFVQLLPGMATDGGPALLTSNYLKGFGKYFSRFLDVLPDHVQAAVVDNNRQLSDAYLAEICGDGNFNANLHPPLVDHAVSYPTAESGSAEGLLATSDLYVEPTAGDAHALSLRHGPSGQQVIPLDLGFQNPRMRPPLYQLLTSFAPACNFFLQVPDVLYSWDELAAENAEAPMPAIAYRPRIVYDGRLVMARRRWTVRADVLPRRETKESELEFFERANRWRRQHGLPEEIFLSIRAVPVMKPKEDDDAKGDVEPTPKVKKEQRDRLHKPQFVDFRNPLLVDLFGRATENVESFQAYLYERLPDRRHLPQHGEDRYVTEMVMQLDFPQGHDAADSRSAQGSNP